MLYSIAVACYTITVIPLLITQYQASLNSLTFCYGFSIVVLLAAVSTETFVACILYQIAYIMYFSDKLRKIEPEDNKHNFGYLQSMFFAQ